MSPCRTGERIEVEDRTPRRDLAAVYRELAQRPGRAIFIELGGQREGKTLRAESLRRAYGEGPGCREELDQVYLRANGTDPLWHLDMRAEAVLLRRIGEYEPERYPAAPLERHGAEFRYEGASGKSVLRFTVRAARCHDPMTGAIYTLRIDAERDGAKLSGCAYWGDLPTR